MADPLNYTPESCQNRCSPRTGNIQGCVQLTQKSWLFRGFVLVAHKTIGLVQGQNKARRLWLLVEELVFVVGMKMRTASLSNEFVGV